MPSLTYRILDAIADSFNPILGIVAIVVPFRQKVRSISSTIAYFVSAGAAISVVYLVRALDAHYHLWASRGLDYSTHSAFAAALAVSVGAFQRRWLVPVIVATLVYFVLELIMRYHGPLDILSSAGLTALVAALFHRAAAPMMATPRSQA